MPAIRHTKKANTPKKSRQWSHVRASEMARGASPGRADMIANGVLKRGSRGGRRMRRG
jgi:hypothetical protein